MTAPTQLKQRRLKQRLRVELATTIADIEESQKLRYRIFARELGAEIAGAYAELDADHYDPYCQHLLVRDSLNGNIIGSTRLLSDTQAKKAGGFYSACEFDIDAIVKLPGRRLEIGRTCIDPAYREGAAIAVLWSGLADYVRENEIDMLFGCASVEMRDGGVVAQAIMNHVRKHAISPSDCRAIPRNPLPALPAGAEEALAAPLPPLLKAYFNLGAKACGEPCFDPAFNCADFLVLVKLDEMNASYARHFLDRAMKG